MRAIRPFTSGRLFSTALLPAVLLGVGGAAHASPTLKSLPDLPGSGDATPHLGRDGQKLELGFDGKQKVWDARLDQFFDLKPALTLDYGRKLTDHLAAGAAVHSDSTHSDFWFNGVFAPGAGLRLRLAGGQLRTGADSVAGDAYSGTIEQNSYLLDARRYWHDGMLSNFGVTAYSIEANTGDKAPAAAGSEIAPGRQQGGALNLSLQPLPGSHIEFSREARAQTYVGADNLDSQTTVSNRVNFSQQLGGCLRLQGGYSSDDVQNQLDLRVERHKWSFSVSRTESGSASDMRFGIGYSVPLGRRPQEQQHCAPPAAAPAPASIVEASVKRPDQFPVAPLTTIVSSQD